MHLFYFPCFLSHINLFQDSRAGLPLLLTGPGVINLNDGNVKMILF